MTVNKFIAVIIMWIVAQFLCLSVNGALFGAAGEGGWREMLDTFTVVQLISGDLDWSFIITLPVAFFKDLWTVLSFDYPCFQGYLIIVKLLLNGLSIGLVWGLVSTFKRSKT